MKRLRTIDRGSFRNELGDFFQNGKRHSIRRWQHQQPVAHAARRGDFAILHLHEIEQHIGITHIVVIAFGGGWLEGGMADADGNTLPVEIAKISGEMPSLQEFLTTAQVGDPG